MKEIIVKIEPFVLKQKVFIKEDGKEGMTVKEMSQKNLINFLEFSACDCDCMKVHLFGSEKLTSKIKEECLCNNLFAKNNVDIIINGKVER